MTGGLPNSVMSAPAKKVSSIAATRPCRTAAPSAFTGGLFDVTISTSPCRLVEIGLVAGLSITSVITLSFRISPASGAGKGH